MKTLRDFIPSDFICDVAGDLGCIIDDIETNSKQVKTKDPLFIALRGVFVNGEDFISEAIKNGAKAVVVDENFNLEEHKNGNVVFVKIFNLKKNVGTIISNFFDNPTNKLKVIAVTGTCGKTSVAFLGQQLFNLLGKRSGLISTVHIDDGVKKVKSEMTTPGMLVLQRYFAEMVKNNLEFCFMEASSHALDQGRLDGSKICGAIFTNASDHEHLDYHKNFENYLEAKKKLFTNLPPDAVAVFNADDAKGSFMVDACKAKTFSFALKSQANFSCLYENKFEGINISFDKKKFIQMKLLGLCNVYNILAIYSMAKALNVAEEEKIEEALSHMEPVIGRFHIFRYKGKNIIIDYAHKPGAVKSILSDIKSFCKGEITTVLGCGGNRDASKRPIMTEMACEYSDKVIVTSDNVRTEGFKPIVYDMVRDLSEINFRKSAIIFDRKAAISFAVNNAKEGDFVVILGKGHEDYQIIDDKVFSLSDIEVVKNLIKDV
jgi:UDP-N-acetylmuramoyl-L-alanyl-D-glutamate--2,6-diaminopimelate ligase